MEENQKALQDKLLQAELTGVQEQMRELQNRENEILTELAKL